MVEGGRIQKYHSIKHDAFGSENSGRVEQGPKGSASLANIPLTPMMRLEFRRSSPHEDEVLTMR